MAIVGHQDFWVAGSRFFYKRDPIEGAAQPWIDLGVIQPVNPSLEIEKLELEDSAGGVKRTVDERVVKIDETFDITCNNLNLDNLALLFLADPPEAFNQIAEIRQVQHGSLGDGQPIAGKLFKIHEGDAARTPAYGIDVISGTHAGVLITNTYQVTAISKENKTLTVDADPATLTNGNPLIVFPDGGITDLKLARTFTKLSHSGGDTIHVEETPNSSETGLSATLGFTVPGNNVYKYERDWTIYDLEAGLIRITPDTSIITTGQATFTVVYRTMDLSTGAHLLKPQGFRGEIQGLGILVWARGNFQEESVREARISITPSSANIQIDDFSNFVLSVKVISDLLATDVAGRLIAFAGNLPTAS